MKPLSLQSGAAERKRNNPNKSCGLVSIRSMQEVLSGAFTVNSVQSNASRMRREGTRRPTKRTAICAHTCASGPHTSHRPTGWSADPKRMGADEPRGNSKLRSVAAAPRRRRGRQKECQTCTRGDKAPPYHHVIICCHGEIPLNFNPIQNALRRPDCWPSPTPPPPTSPE